MAVITVFNQKGGVGKTTTCLNVTAALEILQQHPTTLDLDPQAHLTLSSGIKGIPPDKGMAAFFKYKTPLDSLLRETPRGWQIIPATQELSKIDALFGSDAKVATLLKQGINNELTLTGAPILIDCCPTLGVLTLNALLATDRVLIPVSADFLSLQSVHNLDSALDVLERKLQRRFERRIVITRFDSRRKLSYDISERLKGRYGELLCNTRIGENVSLATSPMHGMDVFSFAPHSSGAEDYLALTKELLDSGFFSAAS